MLLRTSAASPFGRKVKMAAMRLGLLERMQVVATDTLNPDDPLRGDNPLGKIPLLVLDDGRRVYDSRVILECLDHLAGGAKILPVDWDARLKALTFAALGEGMMDAAILIIYEGRYRPEEKRHPDWVEHQREKVRRGLRALEASAPDPQAFDVGSIAIACALGYLDFRKQVDWRVENRALTGWLETFARAHTEFAASAPVG
jgi:glutathione S-transferase